MSRSTGTTVPAWRALLPPLGTAAVVVGGSVAVVLAGAASVQRQLDERGVPGCVNPNVCWPTGGAMDAILAMELVAAFVPVLLGLLLGVPVGTGGRRVPVTTGLAVAMAAGALGTGLVAVVYRTVAARYTLIANDRYELLEVLHLNHVGLMVTRTLFTIAVAALLGLATRSVVRTTALSLGAWPFGVVATFAGVALLSVGAGTDPSTDRGAGLSPDDDRYWTADISLADGVGWAGTAVTAAYTVILLLVIRRAARRVRP